MKKIDKMLESLKFALKNEGDWNTICNAAQNGDLECLKYARDNGCPE